MRQAGGQVGLPFQDGDLVSESAHLLGDGVEPGVQGPLDVGQQVGGLAVAGRHLGRARQRGLKRWPGRHRDYAGVRRIVVRPPRNRLGTIPVLVVEIEVGRHLVDRGRGYFPGLVGVGVEEKIVAQDVDQARHAIGIAVDGLEGSLAENSSLTVSSGLQAKADIIAYFLLWQGGNVATDLDALAQLEQLRRGEQRFEFRLPG